ncbi:MAG: hypothetical protein SGI74_03485 [Oligoflexia bacterium]|nr:hypothetical protein [Oligoflexia bacterium]
MSQHALFFKKTNMLISSIVFLCIIFFTNFSAHAEVIFSKGYTLQNNQLITQIEAIFPETIIVCDPLCVITEGEKIWTLNFKGFGTFADIIEITQTVPTEATAERKAEQPTETTDVEPSPTPTAEVVPTLTKIDKIEEMKIQGLRAPYPVDGAVILSNSGGPIFILPAKTCTGTTTCQLSVSFNGETKIDTDFKARVVPFASFKINQNSKGTVKWDYSDGMHTIRHSFQILPLTTENLNQALKEQKNVEIIP